MDPHTKLMSPDEMAQALHDGPPPPSKEDIEWKAAVWRHMIDKAMRADGGACACFVDDKDRDVYQLAAHTVVSELLELGWPDAHVKITRNRVTVRWREAPKHWWRFW